MSRTYMQVPVARCTYCQKLKYLLGWNKSIPVLIRHKVWCKCPRACSFEYALERSQVMVLLPQYHFVHKMDRKYQRYMRRLGRKQERYYAKKELRDIKKFWNDSKTLPEYLMATKRQARRLDSPGPWW